MNPNHHPADPLHPAEEPPSRSFWTKLGGGSLSISVFLHLILLLIGVIWVFQIIPPAAPPKVDFTPNSGGGGAPSSAQERKYQVRMTQPTLSRVAAVNAESSFVLPEPEELTQMSSLGGVSSGSLSKGLGGSGSGGGRGDGNGLGFGSGMAPGMTDGTGSKNPFGALTSDPRALVGTLYDFKQTRSGSPNEIDMNGALAIINDFVTKGWRESSLNKYFRASNTLYQSKLYIPQMGAEAAPAAFSCADQVQPSRWAIVYRGMVTPPRTGKYRFVGAADDLLVVRFNGKNVFDHGYFSATTQVPIYTSVAAMKGETDDPNIKKMLRRDYPMDHPIKTYTYQSSATINNAVGGFAIGPTFEAVAGKSYPIDILLSELPGGIFSATLLIEEIGVKYETEANGSPILPLFRFDKSAVAPATGGSSPPYDPNGPLWKVVGERGKLEF